MHRSGYGTARCVRESGVHEAVKWAQKADVTLDYAADSRAQSGSTNDCGGAYGRRGKGNKQTRVRPSGPDSADAA